MLKRMFSRLNYALGHGSEVVKVPHNEPGLSIEARRALFGCNGEHVPSRIQTIHRQPEHQSEYKCRCQGSCCSEHRVS